MTASTPIIERLLEKLGRLRKLDRRRDYFGAKGHDYEILPVAAEAVAARETALGYSFPSEYREWLLRVGCGAGPGYGLMRLDEVGPAWWDDTMPRGHGGDVACLSDITLTHVAAIRPKRRDVPEYQYASYAHISTDSMSGFLAVADVGCGGYVGLLTAGPLSGKVFTASSEPVEPRTAMCALWPKGAHKPAAGGREIVLEPEKAFGFFDWYQEWLDRGIANYTGVARLPFIGIRLARARQRLRKE